MPKVNLSKSMIHPVGIKPFLSFLRDFTLWQTYSPASWQRCQKVFHCLCWVLRCQIRQRWVQWKWSRGQCSIEPAKPSKNQKPIMIGLAGFFHLNLPFSLQFVPRQVVTTQYVSEANSNVTEGRLTLSWWAYCTHMQPENLKQSCHVTVKHAFKTVHCASEAIMLLPT